MADGIHEGHRQRMLEKFLKNGLGAFSDHEVLEVLLFFAIPRKNTNELGHRLMQRFGSLCEVFQAPFEQLRKVEGIGFRAAVLIKFVYALFGRFQEDRVKVSRYSAKLTSRERVGEYFVPQFIGETDEVLLAAYLDGTGRVIKCVECGRGSRDRVLTDVYKIVKNAMLCDAHGVALAHNHPNGKADPSQSDIDMTKKLRGQLEELRIQLIDHCVVAGDRFVSVFSYIQPFGQGR